MEIFREAMKKTLDVLVAIRFLHFTYVLEYIIADGTRTRHDRSAGIEILKYIAEKKVCTHKIREEFCTTIIIE
ncbi:unnamed protein product [Albugo candida]|uniref:Uncharacterized protein n=1 Tax=Albugo candida TaxID=65357 RepID=A0A024FU03_9STRA|nr:unnamed protein product [Albugo candida]|eukprot:CCI10412.1 unnamed protein product [Albugo candida]